MKQITRIVLMLLLVMSLSFMFGGCNNFDSTDSTRDEMVWDEGDWDKKNWN